MAMIKQLLAKPDIENVAEEEQLMRRKKRGLHDFENAIDSLKYSQKKKYTNVVKFGGKLGGVGNGGAGGLGGIGENDADDEVLIRETQAALKSLSGNWSDTRSSLYKLNDQEVEFPNLFDVKNNSYQEYEISSNGTEVTYIKTENNNCIYDSKELQQIKDSDMIYHQSRKVLRHFVDPILLNNNKNVNSAFKPVTDKQTYESSNESPYLAPDATEIGKDAQYYKQVDSPDSKQYTVLQPAGIGSRAASVMKDIAREGFISVSAVTSTSESEPNSTFDHSATGKGNHVLLTTVNGVNSIVLLIGRCSTIIASRK